MASMCDDFGRNEQLISHGKVAAASSCSGGGGKPMTKTSASKRFTAGWLSGHEIEMNWTLRGKKHLFGEAWLKNPEV